MKPKKFDQATQRKSDTETVGNAIRQLLEHYRLQGKFDETRLIASWEKIMGKTIALRTDKVFIKDKKLFVKVNSSPLKNQLQLSKDKMVDIFQKEIGPDVITEVVLL